MLLTNDHDPKVGVKSRPRQDSINHVQVDVKASSLKRLRNGLVHRECDVHDLINFRWGEQRAQPRGERSSGRDRMV